MPTPNWSAETSLTSLRLGDKIGTGGQGDVFRLPDRPGSLLKRYHFPNANAQSLRALVGLPDSLDQADRRFLLAQAAWPRACVTDGGRMVGFLMDEAPSHFVGRAAAGPKLRELQYLLYPPKPLWGDIVPPDAMGRVQIARAFVSLVQFMHKHAVVIGDISMTNLLWRTGAPAGIFLIDCDSACKVGLPPVLHQPETIGWEDPHMPRTGPDEDTDRYKVALAVGRILAANHDIRPGARWSPMFGIPKNIADPVRQCFTDAAGPRNTRPDLDRWEQALRGREMIQLTPPARQLPAAPQLPMAPTDQRGPRESIPLQPPGSRADQPGPPRQSA